MRRSRHRARPRAIVMARSDLQGLTSPYMLGYPVTSTMPVAEVRSPLSTISNIMKNSPGGKRLIADWIKVLENEESYDAKYYYKKQE